MGAEVKSQQLESRAQIIEAEIRQHRQHCTELANKSGQIRQVMHARSCDFEKLLRSMRTQTTLPAKAQAFQARIFDQKAKQLGSEIKQQRAQLDQLGQKRQALASLIRARQTAVEKLGEKSDQLKAHQLTQREEAEIDELVNIKACGQQVLQEGANSVLSSEATGVMAVTLQHSNLRSDGVAHSKTNESETRQAHSVEVDQAWRSQHAEGISLSYRNAHGHNYKLELDSGASGVTVRLKPEDRATHVAVSARQSEIRRQLERNGVRVDQVICEK